MDILVLRGLRGPLKGALTRYLSKLDLNTARLTDPVGTKQSVLSESKYNMIVQRQKISTEDIKKVVA